MLPPVSVLVQGSLFEHSDRRDLGYGAWIELRSGWVDDPDALFAELTTAVPWRAKPRMPASILAVVPTSSKKWLVPRPSVLSLIAGATGS